MTTAAPAGGADRLGEVLLRDGMLSREQLVQAQTEQKATKHRLGYVLVKLGLVPELEITKVLARQYRMPAVDLSRLEVAPKILKLVPSDMAAKGVVLPLKREGCTLTVAMADPSDLGLLEDLKFITRFDLFPVIAGEFTLRGLIESGQADRQQQALQLDRMQDIVQHQLKRAVFGGTGATMTDLTVQEPLEQLRGALAKVYTDKSPRLTLAVAPGTAYPIDAGDFLELAGNLMDNACKYCGSAVAVRAMPWTSADWRRPGLVLEIEDDGKGIPPSERSRVLERGARADESVAGQGIGLSVARDIAAAYSGTLEIGESRLGGARVSARLPGR